MKVSNIVFLSGGNGDFVLFLSSGQSDGERGVLRPLRTHVAGGPPRSPILSHLAGAHTYITLH